jgi:hypothetical protein
VRKNSTDFSFLQKEGRDTCKDVEAKYAPVTAAPRGVGRAQLLTGLRFSDKLCAAQNAERFQLFCR